MITESPRHVHDCTKCKYIGTFTHLCKDHIKIEDASNVAYDLYAHVDGDKVSLVARFGSDGDYYSAGHGLENAYSGTNTALTMALHQAVSRGLLAFNLKTALKYAQPNTYPYLEVLQLLAAHPSSPLLKALMLKDISAVEKTVESYSDVDLFEVAQVLKNACEMLKINYMWVFHQKGKQLDAKFFYLVFNEKMNT